MAGGKKDAETAGHTTGSEGEKALLAPHAAQHGPGSFQKVQLLDGTDLDVEFPNTKMSGQQLFDRVCDMLNVEERDYFCLSYYDDNNIRFWVPMNKPLSGQIRRQRRLYFEVKFYPRNPTTDLHHEFTRYLLFLQLRIDILMGKLPASFVTHQLLGSYVVQSDLGDYDVEEHGVGVEYIKDMQFAPNQSDELLEKIRALHMMHRGQSAADAEKNYLDNAKILAFYGVDLHQATVRGNQAVHDDVNIGVSSYGLTVYKNSLAVYRWPWQKIIQLTYSRGGFSAKIRPDKPNEQTRSPYKYRMKYNMAKRLWQAAVEHHAFFRLTKPLDAERAKFPKLGQKFRYTGNTQHQVAGAADSGRPGPTIHRGAGPRFIARDATGTIDTTVPGYSTDRGEKYYVEQPSGSNTLTLSERKKPSGYTGQDGDGSRISNVPIAGFEDDDRVALLSDSMVGYSKTQPDQQQMTPYAGTQPDTMESVTTTTTTTAKQTTVNIVMTANRNDDEGDEVLPPYQDDHTALLRVKPEGATPMGPGTQVTRSESKTSSRTYTDTEGNVITEYTLERDGVVEKRVEKRIVEEAEDETDYDKALTEAIRKVTDMNPDLSVQKIEIQTNAERV